MTKLGSASRYGVRYGTPLKQTVAKIEETQKTRQICPQCGRRSLKRKGYSIWVCKKCGAKIAGGAYEPKTAVGQLVERVVRKREKLEEVLEELEGEIEEEKERKDEKVKK